MLEIFKNKDKEKGDSIINALSTILQLLREELEEASQLIRVQSRIELVELYNKKQQLSYVAYITEPCSRNYGGFYYWARYIGINKINNVIITGGVVA